MTDMEVYEVKISPGADDTIQKMTKREMGAFHVFMSGMVDETIPLGDPLYNAEVSAKAPYVIKEYLEVNAGEIHEVGLLDINGPEDGNILVRLFKGNGSHVDSNDGSIIEGYYIWEVILNARISHP